MATQKVGPDPGALERQHQFQRRTTTRRKLAAFAVAAAIGVTAVALVLVNRPWGGTSTPADQVSLGQPSPTLGAEASVGTVTFDGSSCSMEITADRVEPGAVLYEIVNATDERAMFDSYQVLDGYSVQAFAAVIERDRRRAEPSIFPDMEREVSYLSSEVISGHSSGSVVTTMLPGRHAIVCMERYEGEGNMNFRPVGVAGPIVAR